MSDMSPESQLTRLVEVIDRSVRETGFTDRRCLFATTLVMHFAERLGFEVMRWEGSTIWYNRKYVELKDSGYDFNKLAQLPKDKREKRLDALEKKGMRTLHCMANEGDPETDLGGHLCVIARMNDACFFIDPTAFQFQRLPDPPLRPGQIETPEFIVAPMEATDTSEINFLYRYRGGVGVYLHAPVNRYRAMLELADDDPGRRGLNPCRFPDLYQTLERALSLKPMNNITEEGQ